MITKIDKDGNSYGDSPIVVIKADGKIKTIGGGGGGSPTGPAGGDLSGTYPNPSVVWNNGIPTYNSLYFPIPSGTIAQYVRGDGSLATFPAIPAQYNPTAGTGISITGAYPNQTIANTAPDQTVALTAGTGIGVSGTYPNFTITNTSPSSGGTVTSVTASTPLSSTGGTTPNISIPQANSSQDGFLRSGDWNSFNNKQDALTLTTTGTSGAATLVGSTLNIPEYSGGGGSSTPINIQVFTSNGVWTKPANARQVEVYLFGAGGGGGSGRRGAAASARYGGGGAGTGSVFINKLDASVFAATENIWIGSGGTGAAAITVNNTNGVTGQGGGICLIGGNGTQGTAKIICSGGTGGAGGTATANGGNTVPGQAIYGIYASGQYGTGTSNSNGFTGNALFTMRPLTGGTFGGGIDAANVRNAGQSLQNRDMTFNNIYLNLGGSAAGAAGTDGTFTTTNANFVLMSIGGTGGAAGDTAGTIAGGTGGNGAVCCGGGGGGASTNGANSGAGGNGGNGYCIMITYF